MIARRSRPLAALLAAAVLAPLAGCNTDTERGQLDATRLNMTPDVATHTRSRDQVDNQVFYSFDHNIRSLQEDVGRLLLTDRPSRLSPLPVR